MLSSKDIETLLARAKYDTTVKKNEALVQISHEIDQNLPEHVRILKDDLVAKLVLEVLHSSNYYDHLPRIAKLVYYIIHEL